MKNLIDGIKYTLFSIILVFTAYTNVYAIQKFGKNVRVLDESSVQISVWGNGYAMQASLEKLIYQQAARTALDKGFRYFSLKNSHYSTEKSNAKFVSKPEENEFSEITYSTNRDGKVVQEDDQAQVETVTILYDRYLLSTIVEFSDSSGGDASVSFYDADSILRGNSSISHYFKKSNNAVSSTALTIMPPSMMIAAVERRTSESKLEIDADDLMDNIDKAFAAQQWAEVVRVASTLINSDPNNHVAYSIRAGALAEIRLLQDALWDVNNAIKLKPDYKNSYHNRAYIYALLGQQENAKLNYQTACDLGIDASCAEYNKLASAGNTGLESAALSVETLMVLTDKAYAEKKWTDAVAYSTEIIKRDPANHIALNNRSGALAEMNLPQYALRDVDYAIALQPAYQNSYHNRGYIYALLNDNRNAASNYRKACDMGVGTSCGELENLTIVAESEQTPQVDPITPNVTDPEIQKLLAMTDRAFEEQNWAEAVRISSKIVDQDPANFQAYSNRSGALAELGMLEDALRDANKAIFLQPNYVNSYHNLGYVYALMQDNTSASINYKTACDNGVEISCQEYKNLSRLAADDINNPSNGANKPAKSINTLLTQIKAEKTHKNWQKVTQTATEILRQDPMSSTAFADRSLALAELNLLSYALRDANNAIASEPTLKMGYSNRGYVYALLNDDNRAKTDFKKACDLGVKTSCDQYNNLIGNTAMVVAMASTDQKNNTDATKPALSTTNELLEQTNAAFNKQQWKQVIALSTQIIAQDAKNFLAFSNRSGAFAEIGDFAGALKDVNQAIALNKDYKNAYHNRAYIHSLMKNNVAATADYKTACDLGITQSCSELNKLTALAENDAVKEMDKAPEITVVEASSIEKLFTLTDEAFKQQQWDSVIALTTKIIAQDSENFLAYSNRSGAYAEQGKLEEALTDVNRAIKLNREYKNSYHNRGYIYSLMNDNVTARLNYKKACDMGISVSCEEVTKLTETAVAKNENHQEMNQKKPLNPSVVILLAATDNAAAKKQWAEVVKLSTEIIKRDPKNYLAYSNRSGALAEQGYLKDALSDVNEAIALNPAYDNAYHNRGYIYSLLNDTKSASLNYKTACDRGISASCDEIKKMSSVANAKIP